jgi:hypothetical protein
MSRFFVPHVQVVATQHPLFRLRPLAARQPPDLKIGRICKNHLLSSLTPIIREHLTVRGAVRGVELLFSFS